MENCVNRAIRGVVKKMLEDGKYEPYIHELDGNVVVVDDIDVVTCFYGVDSERLESTKIALSLFKEYKAQPRDVILVEAQFSEGDVCLKEFAEGLGFTYVFVKLTERQHGIYIRQALLNIATKFHSKAKKLLYVDSDIGFCNPYWVKNVSQLLDSCEVAQPFGYVYYAYRGKYEPIRKSLEKSAMKKAVEDNNWYFAFNTGFAWAVTRRWFDKIGGFDVLTSPGEDLWFWHLVIGFRSSELRRLPCQTFLDDVKNKFCSPGNVKTNDEICFHVEHSDSSSRRYAAYVYASNRQSPFPFCDIDYDKEKPERLPVWRDDIWSEVRMRTIDAIKKDDGRHDDVNSSKERARLLINGVNRSVFGELPERSKMKIVTVLDDRHSAENVVRHKKMFEARFKNDFEYVCVSEKEINGIQTFRPSPGIRPQFHVMNAFRRELHGGGQVLFASLDAIPVDDFEICKLPDMFIGLNNPRHSNVVSNIWKLYLCNMVLFSGDFSFIYDDYALKTGKFDQKKLFMHPDHCIAYSLYAHGLSIRPLSQFVDAAAVDGGGSYDEYVDEVLEMAELGKFAGMDFVYRI